MSRSPIPVPTDGLQWRVVGDEAVVVSQDTLEVIVLNPVATRLFELIDGKTSVDQIIGQMLREFDATPEVLATDVPQVLEELRELGLVQ
jgi:hypothetical protein